MPAQPPAAKMTESVTIAMDDSLDAMEDITFHTPSEQIEPNKNIHGVCQSDPNFVSDDPSHKLHHAITVDNVRKSIDVIAQQLHNNRGSSGESALQWEEQAVELHMLIEPGDTVESATVDMLAFVQKHATTHDTTMTHRVWWPQNVKARIGGMYTLGLMCHMVRIALLQFRMQGHADAQPTQPIPSCSAHEYMHSVSHHRCLIIGLTIQSVCANVLRDAMDLVVERVNRVIHDTILPDSGNNSNNADMRQGTQATRLVLVLARALTSGKGHELELIWPNLILSMSTLRLVESRILTAHKTHGAYGQLLEPFLDKSNGQEYIALKCMEATRALYGCTDTPDQVPMLFYQSWVEGDWMEPWKLAPALMGMQWKMQPFGVHTVVCEESARVLLPFLCSAHPHGRSITITRNEFINCHDASTGDCELGGVDGSGNETTTDGDTVERRVHAVCDILNGLHPSRARNRDEMACIGNLIRCATTDSDDGRDRKSVV